MTKEHAPHSINQQDPQGLPLQPQVRKAKWTEGRQEAKVESTGRGGANGKPSSLDLLSLRSAGAPT